MDIWDKFVQYNSGHMGTQCAIRDITAGSSWLNQVFQDRRTKNNYLDTSDPGHFMSLEKDGEKFGSTAVEVKAGVLHAQFGDSGISAWVRVKLLREYLTLELAAVSDHAVTINTRWVAPFGCSMRAALPGHR